MNFSIAKINKPLLVLVITLLLAISFGAVGFTLMDHSNMQTCPIGAMSGSDCSSVIDKAIFASHHIEAFQQFTQTTISYGVITLILILLAGVLITQKLRYTPPKDISNGLIHILKRSAEVPFLPPYILSWIALHNKRSTDPDALMSGCLA